MKQPEIYLLFEPGKDVQVLSRIPYAKHMPEGHYVYVRDHLGSDWIRADKERQDWVLVEPADVPKDYQLRALLHG